MKEFEIRPQQLFDTYLEISKKDIDIFFSEHDRFESIACPACLSTEMELSFIKYGFSYQTCTKCGSLFVSPRPTSEMINDFYKQSASSKFWAEQFFPRTAEARREMIFKLRAQVIGDIVSKYNAHKPVSIIDVGAGYGIFLEEIKKNKDFSEVYAIEPNIELAKCCRGKNIRVIEKPVEKVNKSEVQASVICSFEVFEHLYDPEAFIMSMKSLLKPGGLMVFTTLTISGFDLQILWDRSKSISPPHHINFFSTEGLKKLIKRCGLIELEISTPGKLDVDIVKNTYEEYPDLQLPRFLTYIFKNRDSITLNQFQSFLSANSLSSHARVIARKENI